MYVDYLKILQPNREAVWEIQETDFRDGIKVLEHRWMKCIEVEGDHIEK